MLKETPKSDAAIVVIGAGVTGLTTALRLLRAGYSNVSVLAKHMPSDYDTEYTSIWGGANFVPVSKAQTPAAQRDLITWEELNRLAKENPAAGVWSQPKTSYFRNKDLTQEEGTGRDWFKTIVPEYRVIPQSELPPFADWGTKYHTLSLDPSIYLHYLQSTCLSLGAAFHRVNLSHIRDAFHPRFGKSTPELVVNCCGLQARTLGGVEDDSVKSMRGQLVVVANESGGMFSLSGADDMDESIGQDCYIINRPAGGGTALGGTYHISDCTEPDLAVAERIMAWAIKVCPALVPQGAGIEALNVIRHQVGFRPYREEGPRIERELIDSENSQKLKVVHCYGSGGYGFQSSYGTADQVVELVKESLRASVHGES